MTKSADTPMEEDDMENIGLGCALEHFEHLPEVQTLIAELPEIYSDAGAVEARLQRFTTILDYYQEQPHLLDKGLESLLAALFGHLDEFRAPEQLVHVTFKYMVMLVKLRGPKSMVRHMPHEVDDVERVLQYLERQDPTDTDYWATRYMLLLWLAILVIIPFNMTTFDDGEQEPIAQRIMKVTELYLHATDKSRDAAGLVASKFVTRPDNVRRYLPDLVDWILTTCESSDSELATLLGALGCLAAIFKHGKRADLLPLAPVVLRRLLASGRLEHNNTQIRKLALKSVQRVGLTFLPTRVAAWRYDRGQRSLATSLLQGAAPADDCSGSSAAPSGAADADENYDVPEEIDEVLEVVLQALRDKDTVVRWSAAKGVGRITNRLPKTLADEVLDSLMDVFSLRDNMAAWHGGCLALAELGRRGLLTLSRLPEVIPVLLRALVYDELQGNYSVGAAVRDAACYVCWAFARAYQPDHFRQHALQVAPALLCVALFDREVNCRRAASAAFQENVGRQGTFPYGIEILTTVDYFAVGNRAASFTQLSTFVGQFPEYTKPLISHLLEKKINHWDGAIREVTAKALHNLTPCAVDYTTGYVMDMLRPHCLGIDLNARHGALLAVAEVVHALSEHARKHGQDVTQYIDSAALQFIAGVCDELSRRQMLRGLGGELMRHALCHLIRKASEAELPLKNTPTIASWQALLDDCLTHREEAVRGFAVAALPAFTRAYVTSSPEDVTPAPSDGGGDVTDGEAAPAAAGLLDRYLAEVDSDSQNNRRGFALAVGSLPAKLFLGKLQRVLKHLLVCCAATPHTRLWAECRRDGISAVTDVCLTVGVDANDDGSNNVCAANVEEIYDCLLAGLEDYTSDNRGDVGAWIREAAIAGLQRVTLMLSVSCPDLLSEDMVRRTMTGLSQQAVEKIDRTRSVAGGALSALLHADPAVPRIPDRAQLTTILPADVCSSINWGSERETMPRLSRLLALPVYRPAVLLGLLVSAGGITERLVQTAGDQLQRHLRQLDTAGRKEFLLEVAAVMERHRRQDRVTLSVIRALEPLLNCGLLDPLFGDAELGEKLAVQLRAELIRCGEPHKLLAGVDLLCALMQFPAGVQRRCLGQLMVLLCHRFPRIRRAAASGLFETLLTHGELDGVTEEGLERAQTLLGDTDWNEAVDSVRPVRDQVCDALGVNVPQKVKK